MGNDLMCIINNIHKKHGEHQLHVSAFVDLLPAYGISFRKFC